MPLAADSSPSWSQEPPIQSAEPWAAACWELSAVGLCKWVMMDLKFMKVSQHLGLAIGFDNVPKSKELEPFHSSTAAFSGLCEKNHWQKWRP